MLCLGIGGRSQRALPAPQLSPPGALNSPRAPATPTVGERAPGLSVAGRTWGAGSLSPGLASSQTLQIRSHPGTGPAPVGRQHPRGCQDGSPRHPAWALSAGTEPTPEGVRGKRFPLPARGRGRLCQGSPSPQTPLWWKWGATKRVSALVPFPPAGPPEAPPCGLHLPLPQPRLLAQRPPPSMLPLAPPWE